jgi:hypothetical protein
MALRLPGLALLSCFSFLAASSCDSDEDIFSGSDAGRAGAGGSGGSGGSGGKGGAAGADVSAEPAACPSAAEDLAEAFAEAVCKKRGECCDDDYEVCITEVTEAMDAIYVSLPEGVAEGTSALDCDSFDACAVAIAEADCADWPAQVGGFAEIPVDEPACRKTVTPLLEPEQACSYNYECAGGFCYDGVCRAFVSENEECRDELCDVTMFCNPGGLCQKRLGNGVACTENGQCESGVCDEGSCVAPGPELCEYVPAAPATCSVSTVTNLGRARGGWPLVLSLWGFGAALVRRRRRKPAHAMLGLP